MSETSTKTKKKFVIENKNDIGVAGDKGNPNKKGGIRNTLFGAYMALGFVGLAGAVFTGHDNRPDLTPAPSVQGVASENPADSLLGVISYDVDDGKIRNVHVGAGTVIRDSATKATKVKTAHGKEELNAILTSSEITADYDYNDNVKNHEHKIAIVKFENLNYGPSGYINTPLIIGYGQVLATGDSKGMPFNDQAVLKFNPVSDEAAKIYTDIGGVSLSKSILPWQVVKFNHPEQTNDILPGSPVIGPSGELVSILSGVNEGNLNNPWPESKVTVSDDREQEVPGIFTSVQRTQYPNKVISEGYTSGTIAPDIMSMDATTNRPKESVIHALGNASRGMSYRIPVPHNTMNPNDTTVYSFDQTGAIVGHRSKESTEHESLYDLARKNKSYSIAPTP